MKRTTSIAALCLGMLGSVGSLEAAARQRPEYHRKFFEPTEEVVTPHIPWAKPLAGGPLRTLFITHRGAMREVVELAQRLSMDYTVFVAETAKKFGETGQGVDASWRLIKGNSAPELAERLRKCLERDYDLIVVGDFKWDELPIDCRYHILKKVKSGTGLVGYIPTGRDEYLKRLVDRDAFVWGFHRWVGGAKGIADFFGQGIYEEAVDSEVKHTGERSVRIVCKAAARGSRETPRGAFHFSPIQLEPNASYRFRVWYRTEGKEAATAGVLPLGTIGLPPSEEWREASRTFQNKTHKSASIYLWSWKPGTVWFDDVSLVKVGDEGKELAPNPGFERGPRAEDAESLAAGVPFRMLPSFRGAKGADDFLRLYCQTMRFGNGRLLLLNGMRVGRHQMLTPGASGDPLAVHELDYDYYLAFAIRGMLWAARREMPVTVAATLPLVTMARDSEAPPSVTFVLSAAKQEPRVGLALVVRNRDGTIMHKASLSKDLGRDRASVEFKLPRLPAGEYFADLCARRDDAVLGWGSAGISITSGTRIEAVTLGQESVELGQPVTGKVTLAGAEKGDVLTITQVDNFGREVARARVPLQTGQAEADFSLRSAARPLAILQTVVVELRRGPEIVHSRRAGFSISNLYPDREDVRFVMWTTFPNNSFISPLMAHEFDTHGIDTHYTSMSKWAFRGNMWFLPYATRFIDKKTDWYQLKRLRTKEDLVRSPCLTDPTYLAEVREHLTKRAQQAQPFSTDDFSLGDECHFVAGRYDLCFSPTCVADFRKFVKQEYGDLKKLNQEYGTSYATWDQVVPITFEQAKARGRFAQWVDHRRHMESVWASIYAFSRDVIRGVVPSARVGYEGSDTQIHSYRAADFWKLARSMDLNNIYFRDFLVDAIRDFSDPGSLFGGGWYGGYASNRNDAHMRWFPWMTLFRGGNSFWIWMGYGGAGAVMAPDLSMYPFFKTNTSEVREIKRGIGKLLMTAQHQDDRIAIVYSPSSVHASAITPELPPIEAAVMSLSRTLGDIGLQYRVLAAEQLKAGVLTNERFDVVLLPACQALSDADAAAVRQFVERGGCAIADLRPGVMNEHCTPLPAGQLDDLFGVRQDPAKLEPKSGPVTLSGQTKGIDFKGELPASVGDGSIRTTTGRVLGEVAGAPAVILNGHGRGKSVLLNFSLAGYLEREKAVTEEADFARWRVNAAVRELMRQVMAYAGAAAPVAAQPALPRLQVGRFANGEARYVGLLQGLPRPSMDYTLRTAVVPAGQRVTVDFGKAGHVYDVRAGAYLGRVKQAPVDIQPGRAKLYAVLPYRVESLNVAAPKQVRRGQPLRVKLTLRTQGGKPGLHVARVELRGPDRKPVRWYSRNVKLPDGQASVTLNLALNDPVGRWTLHAHDVASGVSSEASFVVEAN